MQSHLSSHVIRTSAIAHRCRLVGCMIQQYQVAEEPPNRASSPNAGLCAMEVQNAATSVMGCPSATIDPLASHWEVAVLKPKKTRLPLSGPPSAWLTHTTSSKLPCTPSPAIVL